MGGSFLQADHPVISSSSALLWLFLGFLWTPEGRKCVPIGLWVAMGRP